MSKRDFIAIAAVLDANIAPLSTVLDFADMLEESNPRFDRGGFVTASTKKLSESLRHDTLSLSRERV